MPVGVSIFLTVNDDEIRVWGGHDVASMISS